MTIENNLTSIAKSLELIAAALTNKAVNPTPVAVSVPVTAAPVAVATPVVAPAQVAAPASVVPNVMPAAPVFQAPAPAPTPTAPVTATPAPAVNAVPAIAAAFPSKQDMMDFVISSYKALGPEKGSMIQGVLESMGYKNINDVPDTQWGQLKAGIEGLK